MSATTYQVSGMTCNGCVTSVGRLLKSIEGVKDAHVSLEPPLAEIITDRPISLEALNTVLGGRYQLSEEPKAPVLVEEKKSWIATYKPILIIAGYIGGIALLAAFTGRPFSTMAFMQYFMTGFFLVFSFFKMLDLEGFANSYAMYDIVAGKIRAYGYLYPFIEVGLGIAYFCGAFPLLTNTVTAVVMAISSIGVLKNAFSGQKIQCACLGTVFNLPVSTVTIIEDLLMLGMSVLSLFILNH